MDNDVIVEAVGMLERDETAGAVLDVVDSISSVYGMENTVPAVIGALEAQGFVITDPRLLAFVLDLAFFASSGIEACAGAMGVGPKQFMRTLTANYMRGRS